MSRGAKTRRTRYHIFVLSLWEAGGQSVAWRFSLQDPHTAERRGFTDLAELTTFLAAWMGAGDRGQGPETETQGAGGSTHRTNLLTEGEQPVKRRIINPWAWQDEFGYVQANEVSGAQRTLYCSGQAANDETGAAVLAGDMRGQIGLALDNLETLLAAAGFSFADIMRLNIFTTDVDGFYANYDAFIGRLAEAGCRHTGCLIGVARLAFPEMLVEIEATAVA